MDISQLQKVNSILSRMKASYAPRDPQRIDNILELLGQLWRKYPDQRLGQLIENVPILARVDSETPLFYLEDDLMEQCLRRALGA